jgi:c-di-AMP phosphodiesterase-like protein
VVILQDEQVVWYNSLFRSNVLKGNDMVGKLPEEVLSSSAFSALRLSGKVDISFPDRVYTVYSSTYVEGENTFTVLYYVDLTDLKKIEEEFQETRPVVAVLSIDSYDEITDDMAESDKAKFKGAIDREIELFSAETSGITKKLKNNRYISIMDERSLNRLKKEKLSVLEKVRNLDYGTRVKATLSIGIGRGEPSVKQCEVLALQALEMCQGRGGDQAAIKTGDTYEFFGGVSESGVEKRTKVKTRVIASALKELIRGSDRVFIMGHKYGDIDSLGASYGLWRCAQAMDKESYIIVNNDTHLAQNLIQKIIKEAGQQVILSPSAAMEKVTRQSLLVVCDTHRREFVESCELYDACPTTVVIDHHRKNIDFIDNSVIFYHEPHASSACEMVSELSQYMGGSMIEKSQADALLAGIMLDTRNFVLRTGIRTFEASAYLRSRGADPVAVKKLFSDSIDVYKERSKLVSNAEFYDRFAIATANEGEKVSRVAASQAADELLNIENVDASFVLFTSEKGINISARSLGKVNVQVIMEALGGGGHHTMAATQMENVNIMQAKACLIDLLDQSTRKDDQK